jgi:hypothetical protein
MITIEGITKECYGTGSKKVWTIKELQEECTRRGIKFTKSTWRKDDYCKALLGEGAKAEKKKVLEKKKEKIEKKLEKSREALKEKISHRLLLSDEHLLLDLGSTEKSQIVQEWDIYGKPELVREFARIAPKNTVRTGYGDFGQFRIIPVNSTLIFLQFSRETEGDLVLYNTREQKIVKQLYIFEPSNFGVSSNRHILDTFIQRERAVKGKEQLQLQIKVIILGI